MPERARELAVRVFNSMNLSHEPSLAVDEIYEFCEEIPELILHAERLEYDIKALGDLGCMITAERFANYYAQRHRVDKNIEMFSSNIQGRSSLISSPEKQNFDLVGALHRHTTSI